MGLRIIESVAGNNLFPYLLICGGVLALYAVMRRSKKTLPYPPGPWGLPILGSLLSLRTTPHLVFNKWAKIYGSVFMVKLGSRRAVVVDDFPTIQQLFNDPIFCGRPEIPALSIVSGGKFGIAFTDGPGWWEQRQFTHRHLRVFGFGKTSMESLIMEEVDEVLAWLKQEEGKPVSVSRNFSLSVLNALSSILSGTRYAHNDFRLKHALDQASSSFEELPETGLYLFFPTIAKWFPSLCGWNKLQAAVQPLRRIIRDTVEDQRELTREIPDAEPRNFIQAYLNEVKGNTDPTSTFYGETGYKSLVAVVADLFSAGSETLSTTLTWAILYIVTHKEVQEELQAEIDAVVGQTRPPSLTDRPTMPYTEAVIQETLRKSSIVPMGLLHETMADTTLKNYTIPKGTLVITNQYSVQHNGKTWGDPENFRPGRFIPPESSKYKIIPFSIGKRVCIGEQLARDQLFLFISNIFQRYTIVPDPARTPPSLEPKIGFLMAPKPFTVVATERNA